jgi:transcriptional regulator with XRE-family HTH domain
MVPSATAAQISARFRSFVAVHYETAYELTVALGLAHSTVQGWIHKTRARIPDTTTLVQLATDTGISLDWLLMGEGSELRGASMPTRQLQDELREHAVGVVATARRLTRKAAARHVVDGERLLRLVDEYACSLGGMVDAYELRWAGLRFTRARHGA